ncbi:MAG TPA: PqqD family protein [Myxococcaceae bacterium]|nr:PqqD family protein [Myxococcaceae bacterium]
MAIRPKARLDQLLVQRTGADTLVYDERTHRAHSLDARAARVWELCDGTRTEKEIAVAYGEGAPGAAVVSWTLGELERSALLEDDGHAARAALSRRALMKTVGLAAIPVIVAITAPRARAATSCTTVGQPCTTTANCCTGLVCTPPPGPGICQ